MPLHCSVSLFELDFALGVSLAVSVSVRSVSGSVSDRRGTRRALNRIERTAYRRNNMNTFFLAAV